ncbi:MAG: ribonuclease HII, partial [Chloroflexi bacterium]|nr:ribonuclease HII [Chloroflexota bacterium]
MPTTVPDTREEEACLRLGYRRVAGVDEVGRGPLAGPVVAAAVVLPACRGVWWEEVRDSKALTPLARARLAPRIEAEAGVGIGLASSHEIDTRGLTGATRLAMQRALGSLLAPPDFLLVDGLPTAWLGLPQRAIVGGDAICLSIAAASVVAKLFRDR